jgi:DNA-binding SARP family transcriptional activator
MWTSRTLNGSGYWAVSRRLPFRAAAHGAAQRAAEVLAAEVRYGPRRGQGMDYRILGPLLVSREGEAVTLGGRRNAELLSLLLLRANEVVSSDRLVEDLWAGAPPANPRKAVQVYVSRLRKTLGVDVLETLALGYVLHVGKGELDVWRFEQLVAEGRQAFAVGDPIRAATLLRHALALWRGPALADVMYEPFAQAEAARLEELRLCCIEAKLEADLALGRHADLIGELEALIDRHGDRERLRGQLMVALYRSGRQAEALEVYRETRTRLVNELGLEPGPDLRSLETAILNHDPRLTWTPPRATAPNVRRPDRIFVGRGRQLAQLMAGVEDLQRGGGSLFLLRGEPGIGKTWLAEEGAARAAERGALVLAGRCWESGGAPAYWPWVQCLRKLVQQTDPDTLAAQLGVGAADVARIVPELRELVPSLPQPPAIDPEGARFRLFDAVTTLLRHASRSRPIVLVLDDLHAADEPSLLLLRFLTEALGDAQLLVIATRRDSDPAASESFAATVAELARSERFHDVGLAGLGREEVARLVDAAGTSGASDELVTAIHERTDGHPFFVAELVRLLASEDRLDAIPQGVRAVVAQRLGLLSQDCRRMLAVASVVGRDFASDVLSRAGDVDPERLADLLGEALGAKAVASVPGAPGQFRFAHALVREVLYDDLSINQRMRLHRGVAEALEAIRGPELERHLAELAHHYFHAAPGDSAARAVDYAARAAERAVAELAYEEAARLYEMAVTAHELQPGADALVRCELLLGLAAAQASANDLIAAKDTFVRAADVARSGGMANQLARAAFGYSGGMVPWPADDARVIPLIEEALAAIGENGGFLRVRLLARLASLRRSCSGTVEAVELARRLDDPATLAWALQARCALAWGPDSLDELLVLTEESIAAAETAKDPEQSLNGRLLRLEVLFTLGRIGAAQDELALAKRLAQQLRLPSARWHVAVHETGLALLGGRFADADALIEHAHDLGKQSSSVEVKITEVVQRFPVLLEQRQLQELRQALEEIAAAQPLAGVYRCMLARLECEAGNQSAALSTLELVARNDWAALRHSVESLLAFALLAETVALFDDRERASQLYDLLAPYASLIAVAPHFFPIGAVSRYVGMLAAVLSRLDEAACRLEHAATTNATIGARPWVAHAKADHARVLLTRQAPGDREHASELLGEALAIHEQLGMTASADRVAALQAESAAPPSPAARRKPPADTVQRRA